MTVSPSINVSDALSTVEDIKQQYEVLCAEVESAGNDPEEVALLDRLAAKIEEALAKASGMDVSVSTVGGGTETPVGTNPPGVVPPAGPVPGTWSIRAIVKDHEGANASGVEVRLMGPSTMSMASDANGEAKFDVEEPGRYMVQAITEHSESDPVIVEEDNPEEGSVVDAELQLIGAPEDPFSAPTESEEPTIRNGDEDADGWVEYLQKLLNKHLSEAGEAKISVSGTFDSATDGAVRWFQGYTDCLVDGIVGNQTWSALREDHERKEIGTDGRAAGEEYSETGAEGRWLLESNRMAVYDEGTDSMTFTIASVGTEPLKGFRADILFDGTRTQVTIGDPTESSGGQDMHAVMVTRVAERFGKRDGPVAIQAYLPQELGGDLWENDVEILPGGPNFDAQWEILVTVKDQNGNPLEEAGVDFNGPAGLSASTDANGQASHGVTGPSRYQITAEFGGERSPTEVVDEPDPEDGEVKEVELIINVVEVVNDWSITAIVKDQNGDPIEAAGVEFDGPIGLSGVTDSDGVVNHGVSGPGTYNITATIDGKSSPTQTVEETEPEEGEIREVELVIDLGEKPGVDWSITAIVKDQDGNPIENAGVDFSGPIGFSGVTDGDGVVNHGVNGAGKYELTATFDGKTSTKEIVEETEPEEGEVREVELVINLGEKPGVNWSITAIVQDKDGNPIENAGVDFSGPIGFSGVTDSDGVVNHGVQGAGKYELTATIDGKSSTKEIVEETEPEEGEVREVTLVIDLGDEPCVDWSITAIVKDQDGNPIENAGVNFDGPVGFSGVTDRSGVVNHAVQGAGRYEVSATYGGETSTKEIVEETEPEDGEVREVEFIIDTTNCNDTPWSITVIVKDQNGNPIKDAGVNFDGPIGLSGMTDASGSVNHGVNGPGRYELTAEFRGKTSGKEVVEEVEPTAGDLHEVELTIDIGDADLTPWSINAIVKDQNGNPLENAAVSFEGPAGFSGTTDGNGLVSHGVQGPGRYVISAELDGNSSAKEVVEELEPKDSEVHEVELIIEIADTPGVPWRIIGNVEDHEGNPIEGAAVNFDGPYGQSYTSDSNGEVSHGVTGPARYVITAEFEGKSSPSVVLDTPNPEEGEEAEATLVIDLSDRIVEPVHWRIIASVEDQDGTEIEGATVTFEGPYGQSYVTDDNGECSHGVTGPARYVISAEHLGQRSRPVVLDTPEPEDGEEGEAILVIDLTCVPPEDAEWSIIATVKDQDGNALADAGVNFEGPMGISGTTDGSGQITHTVEGAGRYVLTASFEGKDSRPKVVEETQPEPDETREAELIVDLSGTQPPVENANWSIKAIVKDQNGNALPDAGVTFYGAELFSGTTNSSGEVTQDVVGEGRYVVHATLDGRASPKEVVEEITPDEGEVREVVLIISTVSVEDITWSITAIVNDQDGNPIANADVDFSGPMGITGSTDSSGRVTHEVQGAGRYELTATMDGNTSRKQVIEEIEPQTGDSHEVQLVINMGTEPVEVVKWVIDATVKDHEGNPINNAAVTFDGPIPFTGLTDAAGRVSHEVQGPGSYTMKAIYGAEQSDGKTVNQTNPTNGDVQQVELIIDLSSVEPPEPGCDVVWVIDAQVNDQNGNPVANAAVDFDGPIGFTGLTDASGRVSHEAVGPSSYNVKAITTAGEESDTEVVNETAPEQGEVREVILVVQVEETDEEEDEGNPLLADVEIEISNDTYGSITLVFDSNGKFSGIDLKRVFAEEGLRGGADGLIAGGKVEIAGVLEGRMVGNTFTLSSVIAASGSVMVGLGVASPKAWLGLGAEFGLKLARTIETLTVDFDKSVLENAAAIRKQGLPQPKIEAVFDLPATYTLSAKFSAIFGGGSGSILEGKISKTLADYPEMLIIELSATNGSFDISVTGYPGVLEFMSDVAHFTAPGTMLIVDELMEIADDPEGYVENRREQVEEVVERISDLPGDVQDHFSNQINRIRDIL